VLRRILRTHRPRKLRQALAWLLVGALAPLLLVSTFFLSRQWDLQREASLNRLRDLSLALQLAVDRELAIDQTALQVLATSSAIDARDWSAFYAAAKEAAKVRPESWVLLRGREEKTIINTLVPLGTPLPSFVTRDASPGRLEEWEGRKLPWFDTDVFAGPLRSGLPRVSDLFYGPVRQGPVVALSVPVKRNDTVPYVLAFAYAPERFVALMQQQPQTDRLFMLVVDGNGNIIAGNHDAAQASGRIAQRPFDAGRALPHDGIVETTTFDGVSAFFAYHRLDLADWTVAVGLPTHAMLAPARRSLLLWLGLLLVVVSGAALLAHRFWRRVAIPLTALAQQAHKLGDRDIDMPPTDIEEVRTLCNALQEASYAERARREEAARRLQLEHRERLLALQHANELDAADRRKDEFLAMLGHELRNPLAPIINALAVVRKVAPAEATLERALDIIERQARQLARLVEDILDLARINTGKIVLRKRRLDLREIIEHAGQAAQSAMEARRHAFTVLPGQEALWVNGDDARLAQIVGNLLGNAAKYTEPGGRIVLSCTREQESAVVQVIDNGRGIAPDLLPHVFDLFEQGDLSGVRAAGGLGIGLHVVKRLVEQHGGTVNASSGGEQRGSVFEVRLPLAVDVELPASDETPSASTTTSGSPSISGDCAMCSQE